MTDAATCDAIVVGGGPAGSTAATLLAEQGHRVVLLERTTFPRYHVGESLLPYGWYTLDRLGVLDAVREAGFQVKRSVRFVRPDGRMSKPFSFTDHMDHESSSTWQVERATFDRILLDNARSKGVTVHEGTRARTLLEEDGAVVGLTATGPDGDMTLRSRVVIDASGRDGFVRTLRSWRNPEPYLDRIALWTYYDGIPPEEGEHAGATTVVAQPEDGWCWYFPMGDGRISVGCVVKREVLFRDTKDPTEAWHQQMARNPWLAERLAPGEVCDRIWVTSDYSYRSSYCADDGVVLTGDAFAFLDPVFSSGVFLALQTGERAADAAHAALSRGGPVTAADFEAYGEWVCEGMEAMRALVFSFYDPDFSMGQLVRQHPELKGDVTDLLIGHLFRDFEGLYAALSEQGTRPTPLSYGRARMAPEDEAAGAA